jgi:hypothetical protein
VKKATIESMRGSGMNQTFTSVVRRWSLVVRKNGI